MKQKKNLLPKRKQMTFTIMCILCFTVLLGGYQLYKRSIEEAVGNTTISFMEQLADHDIKNVESQSNVRMTYIHSLCNKVSLLRQDEQANIPYLLSVEVQSTEFNKIYLITTEGTVYDSSYLVTPLDKVSWADQYRNNKVDFVSRFDTESWEVWGENLIYGCHLEKPIAYGNEWIEGAVGLVSVEELDDLISLESFEGRGTTILIQHDGMIITTSCYYDTSEHQNYFTELEQASFLKDVSLDSCKALIDDRKSFYIQYIYQGLQYSAMLKPVENISGNNWYIVVKVLDDVRAEQTKTLMNRSIMFFVLLGGVVVVLAVFVLKIMKAEESAQASERAKTTFLANMSHEIRTPLNGITGLLYLMRQNSGNPDKLNEYLEKAEISTDFLKSVITEVLDMSKIESGQMELYCQKINLEKLLREIDLLISPQAEQRKQQFSIDCHGLIAPWVMGDEVRLKQIIVNLVGNSLKFTPENGRISILASQSSGKDVVNTTFIISDTGCGMSPEFLNKIWKPFEQEKRAASKNGTGLGTTLSKALVDKMNGSITVESQLGQGTAFTVQIPFKVTEPDHFSQEGVPARKMDLAGKRILVAEDNDINREILVEILKSCGVVVTPAVDGQDAVNLFLQSEPYVYDVILMDVQMPNLNGYEAAKAIRVAKRADSRTIPILALTANAFKEDADQALASGMDGVITKPLNIEILLKKLSEIETHIKT